MSNPLRIIFAGTPDFAARHLAALLDSHHDVVAVYSQPDRPAGRGKKLQASAVKQLAVEHDITVCQPLNFKQQEDVDTLAAFNADIMIVVAYGIILPENVLSTPTMGCLNVHGSLLPRWRGAAPIQRAIWAGDAETGVTVMQMDKGLDTGDMLLKSTLPIETTDTSASLYEKLAETGPVALLETLVGLQDGKITPEKQNDEEANYAHKLSKQEALIDWNKPAADLDREIRGFNPWPVSYFQIGKDNIKVWQAEAIEQSTSLAPGTVIQANKLGIDIATGNGILRIAQLQIPGKKALPAADVINARQSWFTLGTQIGEDA